MQRSNRHTLTHSSWFQISRPDLSAVSAEAFASLSVVQRMKILDESAIYLSVSKAQPSDFSFVYLRDGSTYGSGLCSSARLCREGRTGISRLAVYLRINQLFSIGDIATSNDSSVWDNTTTRKHCLFCCRREVASPYVMVQV